MWKFVSFYAKTDLAGVTINKPCINIQIFISDKPGASTDVCGVYQNNFVAHLASWKSHQAFLS